jgi:hypothetical protein
MLPVLVPVPVPVRVLVPALAYTRAEDESGHGHGHEYVHHYTARACLAPAHKPAKKCRACVPRLRVL